MQIREKGRREKKTRVYPTNGIIGDRGSWAGVTTASCDGGRSTPDKPRQLFRVIARRESYGPLAGFINRGNDWLSNPTSASFPIFPRPRVLSALFFLSFFLFFFVFSFARFRFHFASKSNSTTGRRKVQLREEGGRREKKGNISLPSGREIYYRA